MPQPTQTDHLSAREPVSFPHRHHLSILGSGASRFAGIAIPFRFGVLVACRGVMTHFHITCFFRFLILELFNVRSHDMLPAYRYESGVACSNVGPECGCETNPLQDTRKTPANI